MRATRRRCTGVHGARRRRGGSTPEGPRPGPRAPAALVRNRGGAPRGDRVRGGAAVRCGHGRLLALRPRRAPLAGPALLALARVDVSGPVAGERARRRPGQAPLADKALHGGGDRAAAPGEAPTTAEGLPAPPERAGPAARWVRVKGALRPTSSSPYPRNSRRHPLRRPPLGLESEGPSGPSSARTRRPR